MQKIGILGGGQLGKMLCLAAAPLDLQIFVLDSNQEMPAAKLCHSFIEGDFNNYDDVYRFGQLVDVITIEIEHVNTEALQKLESEGKTIHPSPDKLAIIQDKGLQKQHFKHHQLPTSDFTLFESAEEIKTALKEKKLHYPFVQKLRKGGYDGKGVELIRSASDLDKIMKGQSVVEELVDIAMEIAVIACRNADGEIQCFPAVEMEFHPTANLVEFLACPAQISGFIEAEAESLATKIIESFDICGLLAVELFLTKDNQLLINEVAPRPHNSGHHTIDSCNTSQFQQHLRGILNLPLGSTKMKSPSIMINLLGEEGYSGVVKYEGMAEALALEGVNIHLYGKKTTKPFRKMGHLTVTADTIEKAKDIAEKARKALKVVS